LRRGLYVRGAVQHGAMWRTLAAASAVFATAPVAQATAAPPAATLLHLINRARSRAHVTQLRDDGRLARVARSCPEDVLRACSRHLGIRARVLGENTALDITEGPREAVELWLESAPHRANMLDPEWRATGFAVLNGTTYVQVFGP
jgi:uncharacterized protein YkwD